MMNLLYFILTLFFVIWTTGSIAVNVFDMHPSDKVRLYIADGNQEELVVTLKETVSFLANENLPVWIVRANNTENLIPDTEVMQKIGQFKMYHDKDNSAAAMYFHNLQKLYGVIDVRYIIKAIPIQEFNKQFAVKRFVFHGVEERIPQQTHRRTKSVNDDEDLPLINHPSVTIGKQSLNGNQLLDRSRRDVPEVVYVQALVIVNYDLLTAMRNEMYGNVGIVEYLLTVFNAVDMLYSKMEEPKIKINIAGIIIGTDSESFPSLANCYKQRRINDIIMNHMEVRCINIATQSYLQKHSKTISPDSYNVGIFLTSYDLRLEVLFLRGAVDGVNYDRTNGPYDTRRGGSTIVPVIAVHHHKSFGSYHTIAHEMAHALRFHSHDSKPYVDDKGNCCAYLMKEGADTCKNCLSWSPATRESFKSFFSSRNGCFFIKKPRSLEKPGPRKIWTEDEQCQCYGYNSAGAPKRSFMDKICGRDFKPECERNLRCLDTNGKSHNAPVLLDGTPCGKTMVCWNRECIPVEELDGVKN